MSDNDWWNDLYGDEQATADASDVTNQPVLVGTVSPGTAETNAARQGFLPPPAHTWGSGRNADPFLTQNPAHGPKGEINTPEEAAELEKRKKADEPEKAPEEAKEEELESKPAPEIPPMPTQAPTVGVPEKQEAEPQGVKALLKVFKDKKTKAVETSTKSVEEAAQKAAGARKETVAEATKAREEAEKVLAEAQQNADRLAEQGSEANPREVKAAQKALRGARKAHNKAVREETQVDKEAERAEKAAVREAQQAADEVRKGEVKQARQDVKDGVINTVAPPDSGVRAVATSVSSKVTNSSGWSYLWSLAAAWAVPVTFPVALLDRVVMVFGSPRPLSGTERMDWNLLHGPGRWFGDVIDAHVAAGDVGRLVALCAVGAVPVLFAQLGDRIVRRGLRKVLGWLAYGFPVFFICMPSYFDSLGFHSADDLYVATLAASSLWGFAYSRTIDPGFARVVFRIPLAAVIVGLGLTAPGAAF